MLEDHSHRSLKSAEPEDRQMSITAAGGAIYLGDLVLKEIVKIAVPPTIDAAKQGLAGFIKVIHGTEDPEDQALPSAALLGLGRCGTNICTELALQLEATRG